ncbi:hypothetical protein ACW7EJ_10415 [Acinetobacter soli]
MPAGIYTVLTAKKLQGSYQKVTLNGQEITPIYQDNSLRFKISVFNRPHAWKVLDLIIGFIMWGIALNLIL